MHDTLRIVSKTGPLSQCLNNTNKPNPILVLLLVQKWSFNF